MYLSSVQRDALCELINIGVGRAAAALGSLLDDEVLLSVPEIHFATVSDVTEHLGKAGSSLYCVRQPFRGTLKGNALLLFPGERSLQLVRAMLGGRVPEEELGGLRDDALLEIGNIVLNACIASLSEMLDVPFECDLAAVDHGDPRAVLGTRVQNHVVMLIYIRFVLAQQDIEGFVVFVMNSTSYADLLKGVDRFIERLS